MATGTLSEVVLDAQVNSPAFVRAIDVSRDARFVLYRSSLTDNAVYFVIDRTTNDQTPILEDINSDFGLKISESGRYVVAQNGASDERPILWIDLQQNIMIAPDLDSLVPNRAGPEFRQIAVPEEISDDGQTILYYGILFDGELPGTSDNRLWDVYAPVSYTHLTLPTTPYV